MPVVKNLPANAGDTRDVGLIPGLGRSPGKGNGNPLQYSYLENSMGRGTWWASIHGFEKSQTWLSNLACTQPNGLSSSHVWMWQLDYKEGWAVKNWCFELWCWRRLLRVPWIAMRSNQSILKEINSEYSLEGLMLKLKFQFFGHLIRRADSLEKTLMLGKIEVRRWSGWQGWNR